MGAEEELVFRPLPLVEEIFLEAGEAAGEEENIRLTDADVGDGEVDEDAVEEDVLFGLVEVGLHMEAKVAMQKLLCKSCYAKVAMQKLLCKRGAVVGTSI